jgi:hypothetical protein
MILELKSIASPKFAPSEFAATEFESAEGKAAFANRLCAFVSSGFNHNLFTRKLYACLYRSFGHIAHYDRHGFQNEFFASMTGKIAFLEQTLEWPAYGSPNHTYCDVEKAVQKRLHDAGILGVYRAARLAQTESAERQLLNMLREKYPDESVQQKVLIAAHPGKFKTKPAEPAIQTALF